jgi:hypothetical protein
MENLVRELGAISWTVNGSGRIIIESKDDIRARLSGASPDFADALTFAVSPDGVHPVRPPTGAIPF